MLTFTLKSHLLERDLSSYVMEGILCPSRRPRVDGERRPSCLPLTGNPTRVSLTRQRTPPGVVGNNTLPNSCNNPRRTIPNSHCISFSIHEEKPWMGSLASEMMVRLRSGKERLTRSGGRWGGLRSRLEDSGVDFELIWRAEVWTSNSCGGQKGRLRTRLESYGVDFELV